MKGAGDNAAFTREVGHTATLTIKAFGEDNYAEAVRLLRPQSPLALRYVERSNALAQTAACSPVQRDAKARTAFVDSI